MRTEAAGLEVVISWYLYGLVGLALLTVVSPLIVFSAPIVLLLGPPAIAWWRRRAQRPRLDRILRWWLVATSGFMALAPAIAGFWIIARSDSGAPPESFWLVITGLALVPLPLSAVAYRDDDSAIEVVGS